MTAHQVYEQSIKPLSVAEKLTLARLIMDEVVPESGPQAQANGTELDGLLRQSEPDPPAEVRKPREFGCARHLLSGAGIDVDALMAVSIDDIFADYMPEDN